MYHKSTDFKEWDAMRKADRTERAMTALTIMVMATAAGVGILTLLNGLLGPLVAALGGGQ